MLEVVFGQPSLYWTTLRILQDKEDKVDLQWQSRAPQVWVFCSPKITRIMLLSAQRQMSYRSVLAL